MCKVVLASFERTSPSWHIGRGDGTVAVRIRSIGLRGMCSVLGCRVLVINVRVRLGPISRSLRHGRRPDAVAIHRCKGRWDRVLMGWCVVTCTFLFRLDGSGRVWKSALRRVFIVRQSGVGQVDVPRRPIAVVIDRLAKLLVHSFKELCVVFQPAAADTIAVVARWRIADGTTAFSVLFLLAPVIPLPFS